jgi:hypothetical protein
MAAEEAHTMHEANRRLDALVHAVGWVVLIALGWVMAAWAIYLGRITGRLHFLPDAWWPSPPVHLIFIGIAKLMVVALVITWIAMLLYRRHLRRLG